MNNISAENLKKVLLINPFGIGDVLFTTPMISNLKLFNPEIQIGYVCNRRTEEVLRSNTKVNHIYIYERDEFNAVYKRSKWRYLRKLLDFLALLKKENYDAVIDVSMNQNIGFITWVLGIPYRIGFDYKNRGVFLNKKVKIKGYEGRHVVDFYLELLESLSIPVIEKDLRLNISSRDYSWAEEYFQDENVKQPENVVIIMPGGGASWGRDARFKRWPVENYAKLADKIIENLGADIILIGDQLELDLCREVEKWMARPVRIVCGQTTVGSLAAMMAKTRLSIVNDGGPLHIAVAAGARTISIFGPVDEGVYGPYPRNQHLVLTKDIACRPCYRQFRKAHCEHISCLTDLSVEEAYKKVKTIFTQEKNSEVRVNS